MDQSKFSPSEQLAFATVRIECDTPEGPSAGTGFYYIVAEKDGVNVPVIITNRHVVEKATTGRFHVHLKDSDSSFLPLNHRRFDVPDFASCWIGHPDPQVDLCMMPIASFIDSSRLEGKELFFTTLAPQLIPSQSDWESLTAIEEVVMVGYPNGIWDTVNNMPIFRRGITATHPNIDYDGKREFLIDAACFPGSSGSPVMLFNVGTYSRRDGNPIIGTRIKLLGVLYAGPQHTAKGEIVMMNVPTAPRPVAISPIPNNLGVVIKADRLREFEPLVAHVLGGAQGQVVSMWGTQQV